MMSRKQRMYWAVALACLGLAGSAHAQNEVVKFFQSISAEPALQSVDMLFVEPQPALSLPSSPAELAKLKAHVVDESITDPAERERVFARLYDTSKERFWTTHLQASPAGTRFSFLTDENDLDSAYNTYVVPSRANLTDPAEAYRYIPSSESAMIESSFLKAPIDFARYYQLPENVSALLLAMVITDGRLDEKKLEGVVETGRSGAIAVSFSSADAVEGLETTRIVVRFGGAEAPTYDLVVLSDQMDTLVEVTIPTPDGNILIQNREFKRFESIDMYLPMKILETLSSGSDVTVREKLRILSFDPNPELDPELFLFDPPAGFMIVDGRQSPPRMLPPLDSGVSASEALATMGSLQWKRNVESARGAPVQDVDGSGGAD